MGKKRYAIAGLGVTEQGKLPGQTPADLTAAAIELALADSGLDRREVDGFLYQPGLEGGQVGAAGARAGLAAKLALEIDTGGATGILAVILAAGLIEAGLARAVVCAHGTTARSMQVLVGAGTSDPGAARGFVSPGAVLGFFSPGAAAALATTSYFHKYGRCSADLAEIAVALRANAVPRPDAYMHGRPISVADHQGSPYIVEPLRLLDYCLVTDGAAAILVTSAERAADLRRKPVFALGWGSTHSMAKAGGSAVIRPARGFSSLGRADFDPEPARSTALAQAELTIRDVDIFQFYDPFTITVAQQIEAYGLCGRGEAADFVRAGNFVWSSKVPCNTSGTEHSWGYVQSFTHLAEAVRQLRGGGGATQVARACTCLVTGIGQSDAGEAHAALVLASE
jgi:acetyl-CoA acetyltransferase